MSKEAIREELEEIRKANTSGLLMTDEVVTFARNEETALYKAFDWDESRCVQRDLREQARRIIRRFYVVIESSPTAPIQEYQVLIQERTNGGGYRVVTEILADDAYRKQLLEQAKRDLETYKTKYAAVLRACEVTFEE